MSDEPGFGPETHSTYEPTAEEVAARARRPEDDALDRLKEALLRPYKAVENPSFFALDELPEFEALATVREALERLREERDAMVARDRYDALSMLYIDMTAKRDAAEAEVRQLREENASLVASANVAVAQSDRDADEVRRLTEGLREIRQLCAEGHGDDLIAEKADALLSASPSDGGGPSDWLATTTKPDDSIVDTTDGGGA